MKFLKEFEPLLNLNNSKFEVIALTGGRGSGKTQHAIRGILLACVQEKKRCCFFRETKDSVSSSLMADAEAIIEQDFKDRGFSFTQTEIKNTVTDSVVFYKGLKEINYTALENLKGIASSTDYFLIDEAQAVSKAVWQVLIPTLRKQGSVLIVCYNRTKDDLPVEEELFLDYKNMKAPDGTYFVEVLYTTLEKHGLLSSRFLNRAKLLKQNKPKDYEMIYLNRPPDLNDRTIIKNFTDENIKPIFYQEDLDLHISCDFNVDPMCWCFAHKTKNAYYYFDELVWENTTTQLCANEIIRRYPNHRGRIILNGDASGNNRHVLQSNPDITNFILIKKILEKHYKREVKIDVPRGNPKIENRINAFNELVLDMNGVRHIFVSPECRWILYNIKNCLRKIGSTDFDVPTQAQINANPELKFLFHMLDAITYLPYRYNPIK